MYKKALGTLALVNLIFLAGFSCVMGFQMDREAAVPAFQRKVDTSYTADDKSSTIGMVYMAASDQRIVNYGLLEREEADEAVAAMMRWDGTTPGGVTDSVAAGETESALDGTEGDGVQGAGAPEANGANADLAGSEVVEAWQSSDLVYQLDEEEYDLLLRIVEAEAGSEDEDGRLLVANVVFNRVNSDQFPDSVSEVVLQQSKGVTQFSPVASGSIWRVTVSEKTVAAVQRALEGEDLSQGALYFAARSHADSKSMKWFDEKLTFLFSHGGHEFFS